MGDIFKDAWELIKTGGALGAMTVVVVALIKGWLLTIAHHQDVIAMWKARYEEIRLDRDFWRDQTKIQHTQVNTAVKAVETVATQAVETVAVVRQQQTGL